MNLGSRSTFFVAFSKSLAALMVIGSLWFLSACQGVSSGNQSSGGEGDSQSGTLSLNSTSLNFSSVGVGSSKTLTATATNTGSASLTINSATLSTAYFTLSTPTLPTTIAAGKSVQIGITFTPNASGTFNATLAIASTASNATVSVPLTGSGTETTTVGQLSASPATIAIGNVVVGSSGSGTGTLSASGASVTVTGATSSNSSFTLGGISLPLTIAAGQSVPFNVTFSPLVTGSANATFTFTSDAQSSTTTDAASGDGTAASTHSVSLSWDASTSGDISGYNIYRASYSGSCGSFGKINSQLNTGLLYTDSLVASGSSYCYATTAVNTSNLESGYSNIVSNVQIPTP